MNIVIAGAGDVGFHLTQLLEVENQNITLVDINDDVIQYAASHLDVLTIKGDITSLDILKKAGVSKAHLFIAVTTSQTTNLLAAILAKKLGAKRTIARVNNNEYLEENQRINFLDMGIDSLFSPRLLAAQEIERLIHRCSVTDIFEFEKGKLSIIGFTADNHSTFVGKTFDVLNNKIPDFMIRPVALLRNGVTIIPNKDMVMQGGDHVYLATNVQQFGKLNQFIGKSMRKVKRVMIIGGTPLALQTAQVLEKDFSISVIIKDENRCKYFVERLKNTLVINGDFSNIELLKEEGLGRMDVFIALTKNSETNIITSLTADKKGVYKTIALVDNTAYTHISQNIGVDTLINKKLIAANNIFRHVRKGRIAAIASLAGVEAEIIEFIIHKNNRVTNVPLRDLHLPKDAVIAGLVRDDEGLIPDGDFQLKVGDKVVILVMGTAIKKVEKIFN